MSSTWFVQCMQALCQLCPFDKANWKVNYATNHLAFLFRLEDKYILNNVAFFEDFTDQRHENRLMH